MSYKIKIQDLAEMMAGDDGYDYFDLSPSQQDRYYRRALEDYYDNLADIADLRRKGEADGGMIRKNYAMGTDDIPEIEETSEDEYKELLRQMGAPTETQESGIMGLKEKAPSIKMAGGTDPLLLKEYEQYVFEMQEMGREPMGLSEFIRMVLAEARMGVKDGGRMGFADGTEDMSEARQFLLNKKYVELLKKYSDAGLPDADSRALKEANEAVRKFKAVGGITSVM